MTDMPEIRAALAGVPADAGFFMPPEWASHEGCWMAWPPDHEYYPDTPAMRREYAGVAKAISRFEPVSMIANETDMDGARQLCGSGVQVLPWVLDDSWARDSGPTWVTDGKGLIAGVDWKFNCWGEISPHYEEDAQMALRILEKSGHDRYEVPIFLEGGAIHTDGQGTLLTTENVVLNPNRNPGLTREAAEKIFADYLGIKKTIWLNHVMEWDDTDGHIDNLACFVRPGVIVALAEADPGDSHFDAIQENLETLRSATDANGCPLDVHEIHQPARLDTDGHRQPLSYINFYIANGGIVVPEFSDSKDAVAAEILQTLFSDRIVVQVPGLEIERGGGCVHCITQQQPRA